MAELEQLIPFSMLIMVVYNNGRSILHLHSTSPSDNWEKQSKCELPEEISLISLPWLKHKSNFQIQNTVPYNHLPVQITDQYNYLPVQIIVQYNYLPVQSTEQYN